VAASTAEEGASNPLLGNHLPYRASFEPDG